MVKSTQQALWDSGRDETVEVNQRALIDKVLARYSGKFTVFRELLQNSDDAEASSVEIRFETAAYLSRENGDDLQSNKLKKDLPDLKNAVVHRWTFKNNGILFRDQDWNRLKKIAEGNPDEEKIGAFGVGFYSLFSITDEPYVTSGGKCMSFYWKDGKDQLYVRRGTVSGSDKWTTFQIVPREPGPIPATLDFTRFLASSITFMAHLSEVSVYLDDKRLVKLSKNYHKSKEVVPIPKGLKVTSPEGIMNVKSAETNPLRIDAKVVRGVYTLGSEKPSATSKTNARKTETNQTSEFFSPQSDQFEASSMPTPILPKDPIDFFEKTSSNIDLTIFVANVDVRLDKKLRGELQRSTLKKPPCRLRYELIYTGKEEYDSSVKAEDEAEYANGSVFQELRADLEGTGWARVFIGHSTGQTTGIGGHMAARFIPTVERELIDLVNSNVAVWNKELLYVGGFLARSVYEFELDSIKKLWNSSMKGPGGLPDKEAQDRLRGRALHALKFFTFHPSTPSPVVSKVMETSFFSCAATHPFSIISSDGVQNLSQVHIPNPEFSGFPMRLPLLPKEVTNGAEVMIAVLRSQGMIKEITFVDILNVIRSRPLSEAETVECLAWWIGIAKLGDTSERPRQLLGAMVVSVSGTSKTLKLSNSQTFLNSKTEPIIPSDGPLPSTVVPTSITSSFDPDGLASVFSWKPLTVIEWLRHVTDPNVAAANAEFDVTCSAPWAERVLSVLAQTWSSLTKEAQDDVIKVLSPKSCIPTPTGLKVPNEAYFPSVNLFRDLPIVTMPSGAVIEDNLEKVLESLGVRKYVQIEIIFNRMMATGDWTTFNLVKYLVSVQSTPTDPEMSVWLTPTDSEISVQSTPTDPEMELWRETALFSKEGTRKEGSAAGTRPEAQRYRAKDLYQPINIFRNLSLPIIDWGANWIPTSVEADFIFSLGLRRAPSLTQILYIAASDNPSRRKDAFSFFLDNISNIYSDYNPENFRDLAFVPGIFESDKVLAKPFDLYVDSEWGTIGFAILDPTLPNDAASKLKLNKRPPTSKIVTLLKKSPPGDEETARQCFEILSGRVSDFLTTELSELTVMPLVTVKLTGDKDVIRRLQPNQCFLGAANSDLYSKLFAFVDFGTRANVFLVACGARQEPSIEDFAQLLVAEPRRIYELAHGRENYLYELRNVAVNMRRLDPGIIPQMKGSNMLLGFRRVKKDGGKALRERNQDDWDFEDDLLQPNEVVVVDDTDAYRLFGHRIFCAPKEDILEELYLFLGSPRLSSLVKEHYRTSREAPYSKIGDEVRHLILERLPLFLHEPPQTGVEVSLNWLNTDKNFIVRVFGKLLLTKSLRHGDIRASRSHEASAVAKRAGKGPIELCLAENKDLNMYEISTSLCRIIFHSPKANDSMLLVTILSTDLMALRVWGYDIDGILQQQEVRREVTENAKLDETEKGEHDEAEKTKAPITQTNILLPPADKVIASLSPQAAFGAVGVEQTPKRSRLVSAMYGLVSFRNRNGLYAPLSGSPSPSQPGPPTVQSPEPDLTVTSLSSIASNIDIAIKTCVSEGSDLLRNREEMQIVLESLDEGFCHVSRDLELVGTMGDIMIFAAPDLPEPESLIQHKHDVLARFLHVLKPLIELYKIPQASLQIFADKEGQIISFNKSGSLVMNLRYFEAWHDFDVQRGDLKKALISWYFILAHGIAHNLVSSHNLEHEFYVSSICEAHLGSLFVLLSDARRLIRQ